MIQMPLTKSSQNYSLPSIEEIHGETPYVNIKNN